MAHVEPYHNAAGKAAPAVVEDGQQLVEQTSLDDSWRGVKTCTNAQGAERPTYEVTGIGRLMAKQGAANAEE